MTDHITPGGLWVFCEQAEGRIRPVVPELLGQASRLAAESRCAVTAVLVGGSGEAAPLLGACGADIVLLAGGADPAFPDEEQHAEVLSAMIRKYDPSVLLLGATAFGRSLAPRLAARLQTGLTADCTGLAMDPASGLLLQTRPAFGGNLMATIVCPCRRPQMATVRPRVFPAPVPDPARAWKLVREPAEPKAPALEWLEKIGSAAEEDIGSADVLVSVGRGIGGAENILLAEKLARRLGGALSASRPMVDSGALPYFRQVGQTGKTVAPAFYLAIGISGAIQHLAGVAGKKLIAVNTDPDAPIRAYSDVFIPCDSGAFLRAMLDRLGVLPE